MDESTEVKIGRRIYKEALEDRKGFHEHDIDEDIWLEIYEHIGRVAIAAVSDHLQ